MRGNAYEAYSWAEAVIYPVTQPEQPHFMTLTVLHWIPEDSMCAITLPLIAPTRAAELEAYFPLPSILFLVRHQSSVTTNPVGFRVS